MMKFPSAARPTLLALLAAGGLLGSAAAQSDMPALPAQGAAPSDGIRIDADELAAIRKARERCRNAGAPQAQQACMNQAQIDYYRARDAAGGDQGDTRAAPQDDDGDDARTGSDNDDDAPAR